jgi:hypothetical protein
VILECVLDWGEGVAIKDIIRQWKKVKICAVSWITAFDLMLRVSWFLK